MSSTFRQLALEASRYALCQKTGTEFAEIPAGDFYGGHMQGQKLQAPAFQMARHPVTNAQWFAFSQETGFAPTDADAAKYLSHWQSADEFPEELANHPVTWISYIDAMAYAAWAGACVPSEWNWEKAARGLDGRLCPWGDDVNAAESLAHIRKPSTAPVDAYSHVLTAFGCEQMIGNVSEFCTRLDDPTAEASDPTNAEPVTTDALIILRGSCFLRSTPGTMVCSYRRRLSAGRRNAWTGLRICRHST